MTSSVMHRLDLMMRGLFPVAATLLLLLLGMVPLPFPYVHALGAGLALIAVYHWAIHAPHLLRAPMVFAIGLVGDSMGAAPLGVGTLAFVAAYALVVSQRTLLQSMPFIVVWWGFMMVAAGVYGSLWLMVSIGAGGFLDAGPAVFAYLLSVCIYPPVAALLGLSRRLLPREAS
jgi:rod shape-determining protein MreD